MMRISSNEIKNMPEMVDGMGTKKMKWSSWQTKSEEVDYENRAKRFLFINILNFLILIFKNNYSQFIVCMTNWI